MAPNNHQIRNNSLYANSTREKLLEDPALKKACKIAIKLLRLKTIKKLRRLKETSTLRDKFVDKLQVLRKLKVDSVLKAIDDRNLVGNGQSRSIYDEILQDKRIQETLEQVSTTVRKERNENIPERRKDRASRKSLRTQGRWKAVKKPMMQSVFLDSLNGDVSCVSSRHKPSRNLPKDLSFFESSDLHPSWKAKRWRRKWESSIRFQGIHTYL